MSMRRVVKAVALQGAKEIGSTPKKFHKITDDQIISDLMNYEISQVFEISFFLLPGA